MYLSIGIQCDMEVRGQFVGAPSPPLPCIPRGSHLGPQARQQASLPTEPCFVSFETEFHVSPDSLERTM